MTPPPTKGDSFCRLLKSTRDMGNLEVSGVLERDQQMLAAAVAEQLQEGRTPVLLGGGHETSYGHFLGYVLSARPVLILNWDAHADVRRPKEGLGHSGSPFRQALEHPSGLCEKYHVAGLLNHCNAARHLRYLTAKGANYTLLDELTEANLYSIYQVVQSEALVSFDLDAVDQSWAPGVSAPAVGGMSVSMWLAAAKQAGVNPSVRSIDIVELNPRYDRDNQTSRLAALTLWSFYAGLALRSTD